MVVLNARLSALCALLLAAIADAQSSSEISSAAAASSAVSSVLTSVASSASASASSAISSGVTSTASASVSTILSESSVASTSSAVSSGTASVSVSASVSAASSASTATTGPPLESTHLTIPISKYPFSSFPVPSASPIPGVFPSTSPKSPPPPGSRLIPDFAPAWKSAHARAKKLISGWSLEQKVATTTGTGYGNGLCVGNIPAVADWPGLCLQDAPLGVRGTDFVTVFPTGLSAASTWQRALIRARGLAIGQEFKGKGVEVALGPMMNMGRIAQGGRNWEGFGADPFLSGEAAYETILGMQEGGVQACAKHYINNEQEHFRMQESSNVDDRTEHEIYFHPFLRSVQAGVASVMCSYNLINDTYACENDYTLNELLKKQAGFQGYVMTDWGGHHSTMSAVAGMDMSMPGEIVLGDASSGSWWGANLTAFVENGTIAESRINDMAERIVASWYLLDQDKDYPEVSFNAFFPNDPATNGHVDVQADHYKIVREIGAAGSVLLKNTGSALPLKKPRSVALIGNDAGPSSRGPNGYTYAGGDDGILAVGWGSGMTAFPYLISPLEAIQARVRKDSSGSQVSWFLNNWDLAGAQATALDQEVALVFVNADSGEGFLTVDGNEGDRKNLTLWQNADELIAAVAEVNRNTIVVVHSVGPAIIEPWIENPNITAVVWAGVSGQEAGNSITDVLYGDVNPSGRLPYTIAKDPADYSAQLITGGEVDDILRIDYTEGLNIDYRHFDANNIQPRFEFGFGLSYTTFSYASLHISPITHADSTSADLEAAWAAGKPSPADEGAVTALWLHRPAFEVTFTVKNTGAVAGTEIAQLYLHFPSSAGEPPNVLRGFEDIKVPAHGSAQGKITLSRYDLSVWDVDAKGWRKPSGKITFSIGASSRDFRLKGTVPL
ncbi:uncharacterized protein TRAVEDRAFT_65850 [Trametes versicolor FP-101664 SS1]|uniref:uncharacterized protein n=1 Tax=Trametes versicolor (strain FP-101664) TaxID=717944 RepID=UPI00046237A7|nr:uncharacterized protein TRAVEDRAFT_65850 [Trametes versicolor FP-101664 SS1]EIW57101.1 hypothetical protein TRAVEDRAFT_65850 [Trametes versicolor FP-101664 SS1]